MFNKLTAIGINPSYLWNDARAEIEFLLTNAYCYAAVLRHVRTNTKKKGYIHPQMHVTQSIINVQG